MRIPRRTKKSSGACRKPRPTKPPASSADNSPPWPWPPLRIPEAGATYDVQPLAAARAERSNLEGYCCGPVHKTTPRCIFLRADRSPKEQAKTLLHEAIHAVFFEHPLTKKTTEEMVVRILEAYIPGIMRENALLRELLLGP